MASDSTTSRVKPEPELMLHMLWKIVLWVRAASSCRFYAHNSAQVSRLGVRSVKTPGRGAPTRHSTRAADYDGEPYT